MRMSSLEYQERAHRMRFGTHDAAGVAFGQLDEKVVQTGTVVARTVCGTGLVAVTERLSLDLVEGLCHGGIILCDGPEFGYGR